MTYPYSIISSANSLDDIKLCDFNLAFASIQRAIGLNKTVAYFQTDWLTENDKKELERNLKVKFPTNNIIDVPYFELDEIERKLLTINSDIFFEIRNASNELIYDCQIDSIVVDILKKKGYTVDDNRISW